MKLASKAAATSWFSDYDKPGGLTAIRRAYNKLNITAGIGAFRKAGVLGNTWNAVWQPLTFSVQELLK